MKTATTSQWRREARKVIHRVIEDEVFGHVMTLPHQDVLELRVKLRAAYPFSEKSGWAYKVWLEEIRTALGYSNIRKPRVRKCRKVYGTHNVMPAMREWAEKRGLLNAESLTESAER